MIEGWKRADEFATWSEELPDRIAVEGGLYRRWCFFLADGWRTYINKPIEEVCAFQYLAINRAIMNAGKKLPSAQWTEILYEDLLKDPVGGFRGMFEACGLNFTGEINDTVRASCRPLTTRFRRSGSNKSARPRQSLSD